MHQLMSLINKLISINHTLLHECLHSTIQNEIISLMGEYVKMRNMQRIRNNNYFTMSVDEATDVTNSSVLALVYRTVSDYFEVDEILSGIYKIKNLKAETLFEKSMVS